ncbi:TRAP transporter small permease [Noviherbaspirillum saxi]|uniref:TRAP transporter small permease protein n=1 Tax=Noviherbaspirillum saxi TaxID=2320863 RepID=A0A3A3FIF6_9BURK|nr:TRAP transporter small permease [Noviherbaspirillum saxi]RJF92314.1 TRAP transporter small permease [Noviherbaspirillum saxi]
MEQAVKHPAVSAEELARSFDEADHIEADLSDVSSEDWITLGMFWVMILLVFLQFFSRYALNDSYAWTEELATYCLIGIVFIGASMCIRRDRHIQVDILYRYLPAAASRVLATIVDLIRVGFIGYVTLLVWKYTEIVGDEPMTTLNWPKNIIYWVALAGFAMMTIRAAQITWKNWRQGYSILERPEAYDGTEA